MKNRETVLKIADVEYYEMAEALESLARQFRQVLPDYILRESDPAVVSLKEFIAKFSEVK